YAGVFVQLSHCQVELSVAATPAGRAAGFAPRGLPRIGFGAAIGGDNLQHAFGSGLLGGRRRGGTPGRVNLPAPQGLLLGKGAVLRAHFSHGLISTAPVHIFLSWHPQHLPRSEEHTSELQSRENLVCRLLLEKKN